MKYTLKVWGRDQAKFLEANPADKEHEGCGYFFFESESQAKELLHKLANWKGGTIVKMFKEVEDWLWKKRTIACMYLVYEGKEYYHENDFGYGYDANSAEFMYYDGNYSCDCNKSSFLAQSYAELAEIETEVCGDEIEIKNFRIEYRD